MLPKGPDLGQSISKGGAEGPVVEQRALWWSRGPCGGAGLTELLCFLFQVLLVSSSRHPDQWIVPGGGMEPEEEPCGAAVREVFEEVSSPVIII
jgi:8-oxo-dGTP pyrophosphatase MutT (NUDIX family)